jgi:DNA repair protein RecO (recombination protein O)
VVKSGAPGVGPLSSDVQVVIDEGVCVRQWDWSETSQTVSIFCRGLGLLRGLAKGSRRPLSPYSGGIELLTRGGAGVIVRPSSELALITEWDLRETFPALRRVLRAHYAAMYMAELVQHCVHDHDPHPVLYDALVSGLRGLGDDEGEGEGGVVDAALVRFQWMVLRETGYRPTLGSAGGVGGAVSAGGGAYLRFSPSRGALIEPGEALEERTWRVRRETIRTLLRFSELCEELDGGETGVVYGADPGEVPGESESLHRANCLLAAYLRHVLGREVRTLTLLFGKRLPS